MKKRQISLSLHVTDSVDFIEQTIKLKRLSFVLFCTIYISQPVKYFDLVQVVKGVVPFVFIVNME